MSESKKYLVWLLLIYAAVRIPLMLSPLEIISNDIYRGMVAVELLNGLRLPFWDYTPDSYGGGALLAGLWTAPLFLIFGKTMFALKMAPFLWHILSLIAWYFVFVRTFSPKQTFFILLFFALPPPRITEYTLLNNGYHFEMILWMALSIILFRRVLENMGPARLLPAFSNIFLLGLLGGFSSCMILTNLATVLVIWIYVALWRKGGIHKFAFYGVYLFGFLIGFSPWLAYNWHYGWKGTAIVEYFFSIGNPFLFLSENIPFVIQRGLRGLFGFREFSPLPKRIFMECYTLIYFSSFVYLIWDKCKAFKELKGVVKNAGDSREGGRGAPVGGDAPKRLAGPAFFTTTFDIETFGLFFQCVLFGLAFVTKNAGREYYLFPMIPFFGMTIVMAAMRLNRRFQISLATFCIGAGILGNVSLIKFHDFGTTLSMKGYSYITLAESFEATFGDDFPVFQKKIITLMQNRPVGVKKIFYSSLPSAAFRIKDKEQIWEYLNFIQQTESLFQPILYEKLGTQVSIFSQFKTEKLKDFFEEFGVSPLEFPEIYRGIVKGLNWTNYNMQETLLLAFPICEMAPPKAKPFCYEGLGELADPDFIPSKVASHEATLLHIQDQYKPYYFMGVGKYFATEFITEPKGVVDLFSDLKISKPEDQEWFFKGLANGLALDEFPFLKLSAAQYVPIPYRKFFVVSKNDYK